MAVSTFMAANSNVKLNFPIVKKVDKVPIESFRVFLKPLRCLPVQQQVSAFCIKMLSQESCVNLVVALDGCFVIFVKGRRPM
uniref:Uncharacterized protein LOC104212858 isoform X2 n=1 Tax=Nicotiana sylvestris TaxID=4096 RepID=A0A1U7VDY5_NICSY|nr:PREDICTED: uncharacterized protein LOC104212858 isoform X2 [Nicotiana sylvestris]